MDTKVKLLIILNAVLIFSIVLIFLPGNNTNPSPEGSSLETCKTLSFSGEDKINIVFFSTQNQAEKYSDYFLTINPISKNKNAFNFYYIDSYTPSCELYKDKALLCYDKETIKKAASCPNDFIVVLGEEDRTIRSSAYMNLMSINTKHSLNVLLHEFGHVFVDLAEEYVPATLPRNAKNCKDNCDKFDIKNGCFLGCSESDYYRSISEGIMRNLNSKNFGMFNDRIIINEIGEILRKRKTTSFGISGNAIENRDCLNQNYYLVEGKYAENKITIKDQHLEQGCMNDLGAGNFEYRLTTQDDRIKVGEFNPEFIFTEAQDIETQNQIEGEIFLSDKTFILKTPVTENPKTLEILKDGRLLSTIDIGGGVTAPVDQLCEK